MSTIVPAVLPKNRDDLTERLARFAAVPDITEVQIDIVDGRFASPASWPYVSEAGRNECSAMISACEHIPQAGRFRFDLDLMILSPEEIVGEWVALGASRLTVHAESTLNIARLIHTLKEDYGYQKAMPDLLSLGLGIGIESDIALLAPYIDDINYVQFMGIKTIGRQGEPFDRRVLEKITTFRARYPHIPLQIDGGVTLESAPALLAAGASRLVVGHAIGEAPDVAAAFHSFESLSERYGTYK